MVTEDSFIRQVQESGGRLEGVHMNQADLYAVAPRKGGF